MESKFSTGAPVLNWEFKVKVPNDTDKNWTGLPPFDPKIPDETSPLPVTEPSKFHDIKTIAEPIPLDTHTPTTVVFGEIAPMTLIERFDTDGGGTWSVEEFETAQMMYEAYQTYYPGDLVGFSAYVADRGGTYPLTHDKAVEIVDDLASATTV